MTKLDIFLHEWRELIEWRTIHRHDRVVVTNGVFDILHAGHVDMLKKARTYGDVLVVGINSDKAARILKGPSRPINNQFNRKKVLEALYCVHLVYIFDNIKATEFLQVIDPTIYVKSSQYNLDSMDQNEKKVLDNYGSQIVFVPNIDGISTTDILKKI